MAQKHEGFEVPSRESCEGGRLEGQARLVLGRECPENGRVAKHQTSSLKLQTSKTSCIPLAEWGSRRTGGVPIRFAEGEERSQVICIRMARSGDLRDDNPS
jgi:hypothetical protein